MKTKKSLRSKVLFAIARLVRRDHLQVISPDPRMIKNASPFRRGIFIFRKIRKLACKDLKGNKNNEAQRSEFLIHFIGKERSTKLISPDPYLINKMLNQFG
ncbi:MAG: hypothetical protein AB7O73_08785 [Bacteroidia bacterium]